MNHCVKLLLLFAGFSFFISCKKNEIKSNNASLSPITYFNFPGNAELYNVQSCADGGLIYSGFMNGKGLMDYDGFLMKLNNRGKQEWIKNYGGRHADYFYHTIQTSDGGFIAVGKTASYGLGITNGDLEYDAYMVKTDAHGNVQWEKTVGSKYTDEFDFVLETPDHFFIATGTSANANAQVIYTCKFNASGSLIWQSGYSLGTYSNIGKGIAIAPNGDYIIAGLVSYNTTPDETGRFCTVLLNLNPNSGAENWENNFTNYYRENCFKTGNPRTPVTKLIVKNDGIYIGTYLIYQDNRTLIQLLKADFAGQFEWQRQYEDLGFTVLTDMKLTDDGGFMIVGGQSPEAANMLYYGGFKSLKTLLLKVDEAGAIEWTKALGSAATANLSAGISATTDGWYIGGQSLVLSSSEQNMFLLKIDKSGNLLPLNK